MGCLVCETGLYVQGKVGASVVGVHAWCATSPFDRVIVGLGSVQMSCEGVTGLLSRWAAGLGLTKGDRGFAGQRSLMLGMGLINLSVSITQLNCCGSCGLHCA